MRTKGMLKKTICTTLIISLSANMLPLFQKNTAGVEVLPISDQENSKNWQLDTTLSDEFNGSALDENKWQAIPFTWAKWRWEDDQVAVSNGNLHLTAQHRKNKSLDQTPNGWTTHRMNDGDSDNGDFVTSKYGARTGNNSLAFGKFFAIWVRTDTVISNLDPQKTYKLSAWVRKQGNTPVSQIYACGPNEAGVPFQNAKTADISDSDSYVQYTINGINPTSDGKCKIGFEIKADPYALTLVDDVIFTAEDGTTGNLAPNPGFEKADAINYASGGIIGRQTMKYGYMEARAKGAPALPGACSAIWLAGRSEKWGTEIDVLEIGQTSAVKELDFALHTYKSLPTSINPKYDLPDPHRSIGIEKTNNSFNPSADYHVYGLEWGPGYQKYYIDGTLAAEFYGLTKANEAAGTPLAPQRKKTDLADMLNQIPLYPHLSLGLRPPYRDGDREDLNTTFDVDYIRIWRANNSQAVGDVQEIVMNQGSIVVPAGTTVQELQDLLPDTASVLIGEKGEKMGLLNQRDVPVIWNVGSFDENAAGAAITLNGTLSSLPAGVTNTQNLIPDIVIHVQSNMEALPVDHRQALSNLVSEVSSLNRLNYKGGSWREIQDTLPPAQAVLADAAASDESLKEAYNALLAARTDLLALPAGVPVPEESATVHFIDNTDPSVQYTGDWANGRGELADNKYLKSQHFIQNAVGTSIKHTFTGTGIEVISGVGARLADMTVTIKSNGAVVDSVSGINCQSQISGKITAYSNLSLPYGEYEVELTFSPAAANGYTRGEFDGFFLHNDSAGQ